MQASHKKLEKSQIEITIELTADEFNVFIDKAVEHLKSHIKMDGFRPGQVPKELAEKKIKQEDLLMEAGELAVKDAYTKYVTEHNLEPVSQPDVQIKKIAKGSELVFVVKVDVLPEVKLPDYKKIAAEIKSQEVKVDDQEIEKTLSYLQRSRAKFIDKEVAEKGDYVKIEYQNDQINEAKPIKDMFILGEGGFMKDFEDKLMGMKTGEEKEFNSTFPPASNVERSSAGWENAPQGLAGKEGKFKVKLVLVQKMELAELNDEFAKGLGMFDSMTALKENLRQGITAEKEEGEKQRKRGEMLNKIAEKITFELPEKMVVYEKQRLLENLKNQVTTTLKVSWEDYLKSVKKTEEEIDKAYVAEAKLKIKEYLVLREIKKQEHIEVSKEELEEEISNVVKNYSKEQMEKIDINRLKEYTKDTLINEKIFQKLENLSKK